LDTPSYLSLKFSTQVKVKLSLRFNWAPRHEGVLGSGGIAPLIPWPRHRRRWVVSFTPRPLYPHGKSPWYPLDRRLGGPQSRSGRGGEEKIPSLRRESNPRTPIVQPVAQRYTDWAITALHKVYYIFYVMYHVFVREPILDSSCDDITLSRRFKANVDIVFGWWYGVDVGYIDDVSEIPTGFELHLN
jgi:hypothetical protein